jgi:hypothetical protein
MEKGKEEEKYQEKEKEKRRILKRDCPHLTSKLSILLRITWAR